MRLPPISLVSCQRPTPTVLTSFLSPSPLQLGKKMKKNNVALDIISFGTPSIDLSIPSLSPSSSSAPASTTETNSSKLSALIDAVSSSENSHLLEVEPGPALLSERVNQSPILRGEGEGGGSGGGGGGGAGGGEDEEFGVDPNLDPELAMVRFQLLPPVSPSSAFVDGLIRRRKH